MIKKKSTQTVEEQYSEIIPELITLAGLSEKSGEIDPELYSRYDVKRGLRDLNGKGILAGLTQISRITAGGKLPILSGVFPRRTVSALKRSPTCFFSEICRTKFSCRVFRIFCLPTAIRFPTTLSGTLS